MTKVLILGGGFAGVSVARKLERSKAALDIVLVDRKNTTLFTPLLPEIAGGDVELHHIVRPLRAMLSRARVLAGEVLSIDTAGRSVCVRHPAGGLVSELTYDQLVVALGVEPSTFGLPGVAEHTIAMKTINDAFRFRNETIQALETADACAEDAERRRLLTFVIVGGGFTGIEVTGELHKFLHSALWFYKTIDRSEVRIVLIEATSRLLPELPIRFGEHARRRLESCGIEIRLGEKVSGASQDGLTLTSGELIPSAVILWSAGMRAPALLESLPVRRNRQGAICVQADFSVDGPVGMWALGDCAEIPGPDGRPYPPTAQHAIREGAWLARNLLASMSGKPTRPFRYRAIGMMASLGCGRGILQLGRDRMIGGRFAWLTWRAYYLFQLPGWDRKVRVAVDWLLHSLLQKDIACLRIGDQRF